MSSEETKIITLPDRHGQPAPVQPPPSYEPEQALIGAILVRPEVFPAVIDAGVTAGNFSGAPHALIFKAMLALHGEQAPIDLVTVTTRLKEWGKLDGVGGPVFLAGLSEQVGFSTNAQYYAHLVLKHAWRREYR
jgi:replicative DNA helicase